MRKQLVSRWGFIVVLATALFFRFYHFKEFQYWGGDEEVMTATIRHIVWDRSPTLLVQSASLGFGLGPFYHYFLSVFYWMFNFRLVGLQAIGSFLGVITTCFVCLSAKELGGKKLGFTAGMMYASSFFLSFVDRRLVHLTLDPVLSALTCWILIKAAKKQYRFLPLLSLPIGFSFHEDASLLVLVIGSMVAWVILGFPFRRKDLLRIGVVLLIFILPIAAAEVRYNGAVVKPFIQSLLRPIQRKLRIPSNYEPYVPAEYFHVLGRALFARPSTQAEEYFAYTLSFKPSYFSPFTEIMIALSFVISMSWLVVQKRSAERDGVLVLWVIQASFVLGIVVFNLVFKENFYGHYFMVFFPAFILLFSHTLFISFQKAPGIACTLLGIFVVTNLYALLSSRVRYPLYRKIELVEKTLPILQGKDFSLNTSGDPYVQGGGWTELYTLAHHPAAKSYWYDFWGWIYAAYSLYPRAILAGDTEYAVYIRKEQEESRLAGKLLSTFRYQDLIIEVSKNAHPI